MLFISKLIDDIVLLILRTCFDTREANVMEDLRRHGIPDGDIRYRKYRERGEVRVLCFRFIRFLFVHPA